MTMHRSAGSGGRIDPADAQGLVHDLLPGHARPAGALPVAADEELGRRLVIRLEPVAQLLGRLEEPRVERRRALPHPAQSSPASCAASAPASGASPVSLRSRLIRSSVGGWVDEEAARALLELLDRVREVHVLGRPVGDLEDLLVRRDLRERPLDAVRVPGELDRRRVGEVLALAVDGELDEAGGDRGEDRRGRSRRRTRSPGAPLPPRRGRCCRAGRRRPRT